MPSARFPHRADGAILIAAPPSLLTLSRASRGDLHRMVSRSSLELAVCLDAALRVFRVAAGGLRLMSGMRMVLGLEVFGWCAFATAGHGYVQS